MSDVLLVWDLPRNEEETGTEHKWEEINCLVKAMTPIEDFMYLLNSVLLGEEPTIEDFILLVGTCVAFIAFVLWCCFPIVPKEANAPMQYDSRSYNQYKKLDSYEHTT